MTNQELIDILSAMPRDAPVIICMCSESRSLDGDDVEVWDNMIERHGTWMNYDPATWDLATDGEPKPVTVIHFPGN